MSFDSLYDIDFSALYRRHKQLAARPKSQSESWDRKSITLPIGNLTSVYSQEFLNAMELKPSDTLLDVGCGAGTIAVQVANCVNHVYALDFSEGMLAKCRQNAHHYNTHNLSVLCKDWDQSWADVPMCDVVTASRSTLVEDMEQALLKLMSKARRHVYLSYPRSTDFGKNTGGDSAGQPQLATPSYLYVLCILHQLGKTAQLRFIGEDKQWALIDWAL